MISLCSGTFNLSSPRITERLRPSLLRNRCTPRRRRFLIGATMTTKDNFTHKRFGRLTVSEFVGVIPGKGRSWACVCDCGGHKIVSASDLLRGQTRSCGCLRRENHPPKMMTHGRTGTPTHRAWLAIRQRCYNPNSNGFSFYGGRGIQLCKRWQVFQNFFDDMGERPSPQYSIDRKNTNGDYSPSNCRWATKSEQANNTRGNHTVTAFGETKTLTQWCRMLKLDPSTVSKRIRIMGMPPELALSKINIPRGRGCWRKILDMVQKYERVKSQRIK
jgi:hypothetical protein